MAQIPTNIALTDSLSLKIPFDECKVIDERLTSYTCIYYQSLDAVDCELHPPKPIVIQSYGITLRISLVEIPIFNEDKGEKIQTKFINLTLSSKLLKHRYFEGITKDTTLTLYNEFIALNVFRCSYDTFLGGYASDIDVCVNRYADSPNSFLDVLKSLISQSGNKAKHCHLIRQNENLGLTFNKRSFAKPSLPFIKLYFKHWELLSKSADFYNNFLFPEYANEIENLTRIEATIKNYDHKRRLAKFGILPQFKTLKEYLEIPQSDLLRFVKFSLGAYVIEQSRMKAPNLSPTEHIIFELIQNCILKGYDFDTLIMLVETFEGSTTESTQVSRSRMRKKIKELFDLQIHFDAKLQVKATANKHVNEYLNFLKL